MAVHSETKIFEEDGGLLIGVGVIIGAGGSGTTGGTTGAGSGTTGGIIGNGGSGGTTEIVVSHKDKSTALSVSTGAPFGKCVAVDPVPPLSCHKAQEDQ